MEPWHRLPRGCRVSSLETVKTQLDVDLSTLLWVSLLELELSLMDSEVLPPSACLGFCDFLFTRRAFFQYVSITRLKYWKFFMSKQ